MSVKDQTKLFGTDGIRASVGASLLTPQGMLALGQALGQVLCSAANSRNIVIAIGRDTRVSGHFIESALAAGLNASGVHVHLLGVLPTPAVSHYVENSSCSAGIMITASHNPGSDNGVKLFNHNGEKIDVTFRDRLIQALTKGAQDLRLDRLATTTQCQSDAKACYVDMLSRMIEAYQGCFRGQHIVVDAANGAASSLVKDVFTQLDCQLTTIGCSPDGHNINHGCGSTATSLLQKTVVEKQANFGMAFDGDADRVILVDGKGRLLDGDHLIMIHALISGLDKVVVTPWANQGLHDILTENGTEVIMSAVGDQNVYQKMLASGASIGGESNGHFIHLRYASSGDGMVGGLLSVAMVLEQGKTLDDYYDALIRHPQELINVPYTQSQERDNLQSSLELLLKKYPDVSGLLRASGTEPVIRVNLKARPEHTTELNELAQLITKKYTAQLINNV